MVTLGPVDSVDGLQSEVALAVEHVVLGAVVGDHHDERERYQRVSHDRQAKDYAPGLVLSQAFLVLVVRQNAGDAHGDEEAQVLCEGKHGDAGAAEF